MSQARPYHPTIGPSLVEVERVDVEKKKKFKLKVIIPGPTQPPNHGPGTVWLVLCG